MLATWIRKCQQMPKAAVFSYKEILFQHKLTKKIK